MKRRSRREPKRADGRVFASLLRFGPGERRVGRRAVPAKTRGRYVLSPFRCCFESWRASRSSSCLPLLL